jgi:hypothetical protein
VLVLHVFGSPTGRRAGIKRVQEAFPMMEILRSEKSRIRTLSVHIMRSIAERHGGTVEKDVFTDTIDIWVPESERAVCAQEIQEHVGAMHNYIHTLLIAFFSGRELIWVGKN